MSSSSDYPSISNQTHLKKKVNNSAYSQTYMDKLAKRLVLKAFAKIQQGHLQIRDHGEIWNFGNQNNQHGTQQQSLTASIDVNHPGIYKDMLLGGTIGIGEAYMVGDWDSPDLTQLIRVMVRNMDVLHSVDDGLASLSKPFIRTLHWLNRNSKDGSRKNIAAHYDLGNDLFEKFLDPTMMYSCGIFPHESASMEEASLYKLDRICKKLRLKPSDHLLEIGTGWGSMAIHAAKHYGCHVTTTTISQEQHDWAKEKIQEEGLENKITLLFEDYRHLKGKFDKLVSIEMIEAVGHKFYPTYFQQCAQLLKPDGLMLLQAITIEDQRFDRAKNNVDFIQRYIFPGGSLPSNTEILKNITKHTDLNLVHLEDITPHYVKTLAAWRHQFNANLSDIKALGYDSVFIRMWLFYLCYCEGGFAERAIGDVHMVLAKPLNRSDSLLGEFS